MRYIRKGAVILLALCVVLGAFALAPAAGAASTIYLDASAVSIGNEAWYVWTWGGVTDSWVKGQTDSKSGYLKFDNVGSYVIFARMDKTKSPSWDSGTLWNRTGDLYVENNMYEITGWGSGYGAELPGYWKEYKPDSEVSGDLPDTETANYELAENINDGMVLQAWNWSYANTSAMLEKVKAAGFTTIQISPPQVICAETKGQPVNSKTAGWWAYYQPAAFRLNDLEDNALGTKRELFTLIARAHQMGIKIIADAVINHVGGNEYKNYSDTNPLNHVNDRVKYYEPELCSSTNYFHTPWVSMSYKERYSDGYSDYDIEQDLTQHAQSNLPDLNTAHPYVQDKIYTYLKELVDAGIDGFRVDAAKHIETPSDTYFKSDFLPNTLGKVTKYAKSTYNKDLLCYGEIIGACGDGRSCDEYTPFMKVSDTGMYWDIAGNVHGGDAAKVIPMNTYFTSKSKSVLWNESHDSFCDGSTTDCSEVELNKRWAACAARDTITAMYFARPNKMTQELGVASESYWANWSVREVNNFSNIFAGQGEYLSHGSNVAVIGRGQKSNNGGAVLINCDFGTTKSVSDVPVYTLRDGAYHDRISGNTFTVKSGRLSGKIGDTGIAVLYKDQLPVVYADESRRYYDDSVSVTVNSKRADRSTYEYNGGEPVEFSGSKAITLGSASDQIGATYKLTVKGYLKGKLAAEETYEYTKDVPDEKLEITLDTNSVSGWSSNPSIYAWNSVTQTPLSSWPGIKMNGSSGKYTFSLDRDYDRIIFSSGSAQTVDIPVFDSSDFIIQGTKAQNSGGTECNNVKRNLSLYKGQKYYPGLDEPPTTTEPTTEPVTTSEPTEPTTEPTEPVTTSEPTEPTTEKPSVKGDVNGDGIFDVRDVTMIKRYVVKLITFTEEQIRIADVNRDGAIDVRDATKMQRIIAKIDTFD
ncbi:MAG: hypothetical protein IIU14_03670 [Ruminococcus sp.]|nr:hypothetical protein [Ruminococcus sp.]